MTEFKNDFWLDKLRCLGFLSAQPSSMHEWRRQRSRLREAQLLEFMRSTFLIPYPISSTWYSASFGLKALARRGLQICVQKVCICFLPIFTAPDGLCECQRGGFRAHHGGLAKAHYVECVQGVQHAESAWQLGARCLLAQIKLLLSCV